MENLESHGMLKFIFQAWWKVMEIKCLSGKVMENEIHCADNYSGVIL